jgi:dipeptidyl aminopeptidase/acylaminoacyl peptidase
MRKLLFTLILSGFLSSGFGQQNEIWNKWTWLMGEWVGDGSGQPGQGGGTFSFRFDLDKRILVRKSHSEYPAGENKPKVLHDDLMIIYPDQSGSTAKAIYFDNEGHAISYSIGYADKSIVFTSEKSSGAPVFRLTYTLLENETINTKFEIAQDGDKFVMYIEGKSKKLN